MRHGNAKIIYKDGSVFEGKIVNGKASGHGRHIRNNGEYYVGNWIED